VSSRAEHYAKAEELLEQASTGLVQGKLVAFALSLAQVHAVLATASPQVEADQEPSWDPSWQSATLDDGG
jgi:hypothetical protein